MCSCWPGKKQYLFGNGLEGAQDTQGQTFCGEGAHFKLIQALGRIQILVVVWLFPFWLSAGSPSQLTRFFSSSLFCAPRRSAHLLQSLLSLPIPPKQTLHILILATECFAWLWLRLPRFCMVVVPVTGHDLMCSTFTFQFFSQTVNIYSACSHRGSLDTTRWFPWDISQNKWQKYF